MAWEEFCVSHAVKDLAEGGRSGPERDRFRRCEMAADNIGMC